MRGGAQKTLEGGDLGGDEERKVMELYFNSKCINFLKKIWELAHTGRLIYLQLLKHFCWNRKFPFWLHIVIVTYKTKEKDQK